MERIDRSPAASLGERQQALTILDDLHHAGAGGPRERLSHATEARSAIVVLAATTGKNRTCWSNPGPFGTIRRELGGGGTG
jgi:hypothetical protein